jgi:magnesium transporter
VDEFKRKDLPTVHLDDSCEKVAETMDNLHVSAVPVVDSNGIIRGVVTFDDVLSAVMSIANDDIYTMAGTSSEPFQKKMLRKVTHRMPWLFATLAGGIINALVLNNFEPLLLKYAAIVFFIPFVIGLSGNIAIQASTVMVRGMATGEVQSSNLSSVIFSEIGAGSMNGLFFGIGCGALVSFLARPVLHTTPIIGLTVGIGVILAVFFASIMSAFTPVLFRKLGLDPAISASPIITVFNDVMGVLVYLATSMILLDRLA